MWLVLRESLRLLAIGLALGIPASVAFGRYAALAGFLPARRASRVDPIRALRYE